MEADGEAAESESLLAAVALALALAPELEAVLLGLSSSAECASVAATSVASLPLSPTQCLVYVSKVFQKSWMNDIQLVTIVVAVIEALGGIVLVPL